MSPKRFANGWSHPIQARHDEPKWRRSFVDSGTALTYAQLVDTRIMQATHDSLERKHRREMLADPIGHALAVCRGGPFAIMCHWPKVQHALGMTSEQLAGAVVEHATEVAKQLDDLDAESLMADVRSAIEGMPRNEIVNVGDGQAG